MKGIQTKIAALVCAAALILSVGCFANNHDSKGSDADTNLTDEVIIDSLNNGTIIDEVSGNVYKTELNANPISPNIFCADPTAVEYEGRLYIYGTNDHQQYNAVGDDGKNTYEQIKSLVVFSTDDMVNWIYHGRIEIGEIALG